MEATAGPRFQSNNHQIVRAAPSSSSEHTMSRILDEYHTCGPVQYFFSPQIRMCITSQNLAIVDIVLMYKLSPLEAELG